MTSRTTGRVATGRRTRGGGLAPAEATINPRRSPLLWYFALVYAASGVALAVVGWPQLDGSGGRPVASLVMFPVIVITAGLAGLGLTAATEGSLGLRQLRAGLARWRLGRWWLLLLLCDKAMGYHQVD